MHLSLKILRVHLLGIALKGHLNAKVMMMWLFLDQIAAKPKKAQLRITKKNDKLRYISKYLVQFVPDAKQQNKETAVPISGARVLISDKCAAILKEHKEKIKKQQENGNRTVV